jgi:hypothetical protein
MRRFQSSHQGRQKRKNVTEENDKEGHMFMAGWPDPSEPPPRGSKNEAKSKEKKRKW